MILYNNGASAILYDGGAAYFHGTENNVIRNEMQREDGMLRCVRRANARNDYSDDPEGPSNVASPGRPGMTESDFREMHRIEDGIRQHAGSLPPNVCTS
ncbi:MAG: hypothetical protein HY059_09450 [Proteobacteria bacterium]|nr:hypothetical protein [Pseudomonadota bacterium]